MVVQNFQNGDDVNAFYNAMTEVEKVVKEALLMERERVAKLKNGVKIIWRWQHNFKWYAATIDKVINDRVIQFIDSSCGEHTWVSLCDIYWELMER